MSSDVRVYRASGCNVERSQGLSGIQKVKRGGVEMHYYASENEKRYLEKPSLYFYFLFPSTHTHTHTPSDSVRRGMPRGYLLASEGTYELALVIRGLVADVPVDGREPGGDGGHRDGERKKKEVARQPADESIPFNDAAAAAATTGTATATARGPGDRVAFF